MVRRLYSSAKVGIVSNQRYLVASSLRARTYQLICYTLQTVEDAGLKNLMMSWYYAGYYTGLYEGQKKAKGE